MTVTDPRGDPSLLETMVCTEHARLRQLVAEAGKQTDTPGVHEELLDQVRGFLGAHVNTETAVFHDAVRSTLDQTTADSLERDRGAIANLIDDPQMRQLEEVVDAHVASSEDVIARLGHAIGGLVA